MTASTKVVLVIEDDATNMKLAYELLTSRGYEVLKAFDGVSGLRMARDHRPDLILLDIQMPGLTGLDVIRQIKKDDHLRMIPTVAVTACVMKGDAETCLHNGFDAYVSKPISISGFLKVIEGLLDTTAVCSV